MYHSTQYNTGNGKIIPMTTDPLHFSTDAPLITFPSDVQSHPHMALQHGDEVFIPDLGADKIWRLVQNGAPGNWEIQGFIQQPTGSGPRHIATRGTCISFTSITRKSTNTPQATRSTCCTSSPAL